MVDFVLYDLCRPTLIILCAGLHLQGLILNLDSFIPLALALGPSDEFQSSAGGVRLDTMFVDEGFGSLDDDSLRLAITTLQELTDGNRLVGIISHVGELKAKIDKQIVVTKKLAGGSSYKKFNRNLSANNTQSLFARMGFFDIIEL